jgi:hypothetical protein
MIHRLSLVCLSILGNVARGYQICVVGATSGLGKELVYQAALDKNMSVLALSGTSSPLTVPCRVNSFEEFKKQPPFHNPNVVRDIYWNDLTSYSYKSIVFTTSSGPFKDDYSDKLMAKIMPDLPESCKHLVLISAYGVGNTLNKNEVGINIMNNWYLKDVYRAKNSQEELLHLKMFKEKYPQLKTTILRPKALSYGETILKSITRQSLAHEVLEVIKN